MPLPRDVGIEKDNFQKSKIFNEVDSLINYILNILIMKPGNLPGMPDVGVDIGKFVSKKEEDIILYEDRKKLLATREAEDSLSAFCKICQELGYPIYEMDVICAGEEFHAAMKRSTNGGGENSPKIDGEDDFYELFLAGLSMEE